VQLNYARLLFRQEQPLKAIPQFEQLAEKLPDNANILLQLAQAYLQQNNPSALETARKAHQLLPENADANDALGWALVKQQQAKEALPFLREAQARGGNVPSVNYHLAEALIQLGRQTEALDLLEKALAHQNISLTDKVAVEGLLLKIKNSD